MASLFFNGRFFTANHQESLTARESDPKFAQCMLVQDGAITHIGAPSDPEVVQAQKSGAASHDLQDKIVLPGFIDGHMHFLMMGQSLKMVDLEPCRTLEDIRRTIKAAAKSQPGLKRILCKSWMHSMTNGQALSSMLDDLDPRPIFVAAKDLHSSWCNSAALAELDVQDMPNPNGGRIHRDAEGKASGLLDEAAVLRIIWPHLATVATMEEKLDALRLAIKTYHTAGYTGAVEMALDENSLEAIQRLREKDGELTLRLAAHWLITPSENFEENIKQVDRAIQLQKQFNAENSPAFRIAGIKIISDGVIDACTAALCKPYSSNGVSCDPLWPAEMLDPVVKAADAAGLQVAIHAIGDAAIKTAIDTIEKNGTPGRRHRIEHLELSRPEDAKRLGSLGITASIQPVHSDPAILRAWPKLLGEDRCTRAFAYKDFQDGGARLALGSDAPTAPHAPFPNLFTATTRRSAREPESLETVNEHFALGLASAVSAATAGSAYSCFADAWTGSLEAGMKADFVVVDMDWNSSNLLNASVQETWFEGKKVYSSAG